MSFPCRKEQHLIVYVDTFSAALSSSNQSTPNANVEHDDWWFNGTDNLFLNRSGEHRM